MADQLQERYGNLATAVDELRDAWTVAGPSEEVHEAALLSVIESNPVFALRMLRLVSVRSDDDLTDVKSDSPVGKLIAKLCSSDSDSVIAELQGANLNRVTAAFVALGISARLNGLTKWEPAA